MKIHSLPSDKHQENCALYIMLNAYIMGHWKNIVARPELVDKGDKSLKTIRKMCMTLSESQKNNFHILLTTMQMKSNETVTSYF